MPVFGYCRYFVNMFTDQPGARYCHGTTDMEVLHHSRLGQENTAKAFMRPCPNSFRLLGRHSYPNKAQQIEYKT